MKYILMITLLYFALPIQSESNHEADLRRQLEESRADTRKTAAALNRLADAIRAQTGKVVSASLVASDHADSAQSTADDNAATNKRAADAAAQSAAERKRSDDAQVEISNNTFRVALAAMFGVVLAALVPVVTLIITQREGRRVRLEAQRLAEAQFATHEAVLKVEKNTNGMSDKIAALNREIGHSEGLAAAAASKS